ncbi:DUF3365 domain-containing protein [Bacteriovorax sp. Seq25_V]|uniref:c-type heme family protein n=1 Tax=Bacteriovorax sp. Seq25_V TaxID=1201288 RepID=UPI000426411D|nr:DUF3365 domain-containing protein [Bacteriovorax sp. Seq25_V]
MKKITIIALLIHTTSTMAIEDAKALQAVKKLGMELKAKLSAGMKKSPTEALETCHLEASTITNSHTNAEIKIGRVSAKNRNPNNMPKKWMENYISDFQTKKIKSPYIAVDIDSKHRGLLMPIATMPMCLKCHGDNIEADLYKEITKRYPNDKATGFKTGDIRGYFWAEYEK